MNKLDKLDKDYTIETQSKIIESLRSKITEHGNQIDELNEQIACYEDLVYSQELTISDYKHKLEDWFKFKEAMGPDLRIPVIEVYNRIQTVRNREVELERNRINAEVQPNARPQRQTKEG